MPITTLDPTTARHAHENGFHVALAIDAMIDMSPESHAHTTERVFPLLGETGTSAGIIELLDPR